MRRGTDSGGTGRPAAANRRAVARPANGTGRSCARSAQQLWLGSLPAMRYDGNRRRGVLRQLRRAPECAGSPGRIARCAGVQRRRGATAGLPSAAAIQLCAARAFR